MDLIDFKWIPIFQSSTSCSIWFELNLKQKLFSLGYQIKQNDSLQGVPCSGIFLSCSLLMISHLKAFHIWDKYQHLRGLLFISLSFSCSCWVLTCTKMQICFDCSLLLPRTRMDSHRTKKTIIFFLCPCVHCTGKNYSNFFASKTWIKILDKQLKKNSITKH